jgi:hypothetical protein
MGLVLDETRTEYFQMLDRDASTGGVAAPPGDGWHMIHLAAAGGGAPANLINVVTLWRREVSRVVHVDPSPESLVRPSDEPSDDHASSSPLTARHSGLDLKSLISCELGAVAVLVRAAVALTFTAPEYGKRYMRQSVSSEQAFIDAVTALSAELRAAVEEGGES